MTTKESLGVGNAAKLPDGWKMYDKYQIRHTDGTPLKGKRYFVLRLDSDDPLEAARVAAAMSAYKGETPQGNAVKLREAAKGLTTADIPKVRVRDNKGRVVCEGYYFEYPEHMGPGIYDGEPPPIPTVRGVVTYDQGDWNMANTPRFLRVTPPHTFEVIESEVAR